MIAGDAGLHDQELLHENVAMEPRVAAPLRGVERLAEEPHGVWFLTRALRKTASLASKLRVTPDERRIDLRINGS
jgi:hypothetical protein